jgi:cytochrome c biogenesis protein CcmG, thiol:disulfide interchange protein DsbE
MGVRGSKSRVFWAAAVAAAVTVGLVVWGISASDTDDPRAGYPESKLTTAEASAPLPDAAPHLAAIRDQANQILGGGLDAFQKRIAALEGTPIVVNKWASWCGPCIYEFPHFQEAAIQRGDEIAFLGIDFDDGAESAAEFLSRLPVPYPSYADPDSKLSRSLEADYPPTTVFIDSAGEVTHRRFGPYQSTDELLADIDRYAG